MDDGRNGVFSLPGAKSYNFFLISINFFYLQDLQGVDAAPRTARIRGVTTADPLQASTASTLENQSLNQTFRYIYYELVIS